MNATLDQPATTGIPLTGAAPVERGYSWLLRISLWILLAVAALHASYTLPWASFLVVLYLFALLQLAHAPTWRRAFYPGLAAGFLIGLVRLEFFWRIFLGGAVALWLVFAFWIGLFVASARLCLRWRVLAAAGWNPGWLAIPFIWCGLEYFRSELYYLRFAWLSPGFAFGSSPDWVPLRQLGTYGLGFVLMGVACAAAWVWQKSRWKAAAVLLAGASLLRLCGLLGAAPLPPPAARPVPVAGVQLEFPTEKEVLVRLGDLFRKHPECELLVLSEYTFSDPIPDKVRDWCREHQRYLIVGGKDPLGDGQFYNTAFVISPQGDIIFRQVKSVPIQFFKDGLPAPQQRLWDSPWGKIGICICYDLSYRKVTDQLVKLGAEALIVPTMDVFDWGVNQHELHARVAPIRAAEYGIPIFRVASSGISQVIDRAGCVLATAPCPGDGAIIAGTLQAGGPGRIPLDRWLAPVSLVVTVLVVLSSAVQRLRARFRR